jgi:hypothetical protein
VQTRKLDALKAKFDIFGAAGHINQEVSLTATTATFRRMENLDEVWVDPNFETAEAQNNAFLDREIAHFMGPVKSKTPQEQAELRTLARLECQYRIEDKQSFDELRAAVDAQQPVVKAILHTEVNRPHRATLGYYLPKLNKTLAEREGLEFALTFQAHVMQEAHIADIEARREGLPGIATVQLGGLIRAIETGEFNPRQQTIRFSPENGAFVGTPRVPSLETLDGIPEFTEGEALRGKRIILVGEGGGSDGIQAALTGELLAAKYGCEVAAVVSCRNEARQVANTGWETGTIKQITPGTTAVGDWRFLEKIPLEGNNPAPMHILNSSDPFEISRDIRALIHATDADLVIGVDTGGDSLYATPHAGFSARREMDVTPDHDYNTIRGLAQLAKEMDDVSFMSVIAWPGLDAPPYARQQMDEIGAGQIPLSDAEKALALRRYAEWRLDGSGNEEGRYGKTPLAGQLALKGKTGLQALDLPRRNVTSNTDPWRAFAAITPAMGGIVCMDLKKHFAAIDREPAIGPKLPFASRKTAEIINHFQPASGITFGWIPEEKEIIMHFRPSQDAGTRHLIGGYTITSRTLARLERELPGVKEKITSQAGRIVFFGNGFSLAPLEALTQAEPGRTPQIVIADAIDYRQAQLDLAKLKASFEAKLVEAPPDLTSTLERCNLLLDADASGMIQLVHHVIGSTEPPEVITSADLAVNIFGPPTSTINEQLACLKPDGTLYIAYRVPMANRIQSADYTPIVGRAGLFGYSIKKSSDNS